MVAIVGLEGLWFGMNQNWLSTTVCDRSLRKMISVWFSSRFLSNSLALLVGRVKLMETVEYRVKPKFKVAFKSASMAKSVLGKA